MKLKPLFYLIFGFILFFSQLSMAQNHPSCSNSSESITCISVLTNSPFDLTNLSQSDNFDLKSIKLFQIDLSAATGEGLQIKAEGNDTISDSLVSDIVSITDTPLVYPNPFRLSIGSKIYYHLSKQGDITLHIYDSIGRKLIDKDIPAGSEGGKYGENKIDINLSLFQNFPLSSGVYFFLIIHEDAVLGRGKLAVIP